MLLPVLYILFFFNAVVVTANSCSNQEKVTVFTGGTHTFPAEGPPSLTADIGSSLFLGCCHPSADTSLQWSKDTGEIYRPLIGRKYVLLDENNRLILTISKANASHDTGRYICQDTRGIAGLASVELTVKSSQPSMFIRKSVQQFPRGSSPVVVCPVRKGETPTAWVYNVPGGRGRLIRVYKGSTAQSHPQVELVDGKLDRLKILQVSAIGSKLWCVVTTRPGHSGSLEISWQLYTPVIVTVTVSKPLSGVILEDRPAELLCRFPRVDKSQQTAELLLNGSSSLPHSFVITRRLRDHFLEVTAATESFNSRYRGKLACLVTTERGLSNGGRIAQFSSNASSAIVPRVVLTPRVDPSIPLQSQTTVNSSATLSCRVLGNELRLYLNRSITQESTWGLRQFNWQKVVPRPGQLKLIRSSEQDDASTITMVIEHATPADMGEYMCIAENAAGRVTQTGTLTVRHPAQLTSSPSVIIFHMAPVTVSCLLSGYPLVLNPSSLRLEAGGAGQTIELVESHVNQFSSFGVKKTFSVKLDSMKNGQTAQCVYEEADGQLLKSSVTFNIARLPKKPQISILCKGVDSVVFGLEQPEYSPNAPEYERIVRQYIVFNLYRQEDNSTTPGPPARESVQQVTQKDFNRQVVTVRNLFPDSRYSFEFNSVNKFDILRSQTVEASTTPLGSPLPPQKVLVSPAPLSYSSHLRVTLWLTPPCSAHSGLAPVNLADVVIRWRLSPGTATPTMSQRAAEGQRRWKEAVHSLRRVNWKHDSKVAFPLSVASTLKDYKIMVAIRSRFGVSSWQTVDYRAPISLQLRTLQGRGSAPYRQLENRTPVILVIFTGWFLTLLSNGC